MNVSREPYSKLEPSAHPSRPSLRVFENAMLEKLTHVHPLVPLILWTPIIAACYYFSFANLNLAVAPVVIISCLAFIFWTLSEYVLHRMIFHFEARSKLGRRIVFLFHGIHHDDPHDPTRLVMPPAPGLLLGGAFFLLFRIACGPVWVYPFFAGYILGYLAYDYIHYFIHHGTPRTALGKYMRRYHYTHHFKEPHAKWGVSSPLWDYVFNSVQAKIPMKIDSREIQKPNTRARPANPSAR